MAVARMTLSDRRTWDRVAEVASGYGDALAAREARRAGTRPGLMAEFTEEEVRRMEKLSDRFDPDVRGPIRRMATELRGSVARERSRPRPGNRLR